MRKFTKVKALLLVIIMVVAILPTNVYAGNGPISSDGEWAELGLGTDSSYYRLYSSNGPVDKIKGASYSKKTNTLTLTSFNRPDIWISASNMGEDFKICLKGKNKFSCIYAWSKEGYGAGVRITGDGSLVINERKNDILPVEIYSRNGNNTFVIDSTATVKIVATKGSDAVSIFNTKTKVSDAIKVSSKAKTGYETFKMPQLAEDVWLPTEENKVTYYMASEKSNGKTYACQVRYFDGQTFYHLLPEYVTDQELGIIANNWGDDFCFSEENKAEMLSKYTVDFDNPIEGYRTDWGYDAELLQKNGKKYFVNGIDGGYNLYEVAANTIFGRTTGTLVKTYSGDFDVIIKDGYDWLPTDKTVSNVWIANSFSTTASIGKVTGLTAKAGKKSITVKFKKVSLAKTYDIRYATNKSMKKAKTVSVTGTSKTIKKLASGKKYYVQVRAVCGSVKGKWTGAKAVTVK